MKNTIFDTHQNLDCYFETADGSCFFTENAAEAHSKTLEDKKVKSVHRPEAKDDAVPSEPVASVEPVEPITPVEPVEPIAPVEPVEPVAPVEPKADVKKK